jgi:hypothetical protein
MILYELDLKTKQRLQLLEERVQLKSAKLNYRDDSGQQNFVEKILGLLTID